jgi:pimeloyl-ACP methyl ester carboxylesterase
MLEIIDKGDVTNAHPTPLLFVHGGMHAAWCWDEHFLDYFASQGFRAAALSFRGHGGSSSDKPLRKLSVADFVEDVRAAVEHIGTPPVLIGHSLGGWTIQKYLERHDAPGAVLMASIPPKGVLPCAMRVWRRHPWISMRANTFGDNKEVFTRLPREALFCSHTPESVVAATAKRCQNESNRAAFVDAGFRRPKPERVSTPMLVLGGEDDGTITNAEVHDTAMAYRTRATLFPRMGHNMMVEPGWRDVAEHIGAWVGTLQLDTADGSRT